MDDQPEKAPPAWVAPFLAALRGGSRVRCAARSLGIGESAPYHRRRTDPAFRAAWLAIRPMRGHAPLPAAPRKPRGQGKLDRFLDELAATSNVSAAAAVAGLAAGSIYKLRRENPEFARRWFAALAEGYDNLEMELLGRLRSGDAGEKDRAKFDTAAALRCLAAHRESVAREKGRRALAEEVTTIESINAKIDSLRLAGKAGRKAMAAARREKTKAARKGSGDDR